MRAIAWRLFSEYGMVVVLLLLCAYFSVMTFADQFPAGGSGGSELGHYLAKRLPTRGRVLVVSGDGQSEREFTEALTDSLNNSGLDVVAAVQGEPRDARAALQQLADRGGKLDAIAASQTAAAWSVFEDMRRKFPALGDVEVHVPRSYRWPNFLKASNLLNIANQIAIIAILAIGMTLVVITGGIDLSVGSLIALAAVTAALLIRDAAGAENATALGMVLCCAAAIILSGIVGLFSGAFVTAFAVPPFIVTLAVMMMARGLARTLAQDQSIYQLPDSFIWLGRGTGLGGVPNAVVLMIVLYLAAHILMNRTVLGRHTYAVGGNVQAARLSGVRVERVLLFVYFLSGTLAGLGGVIMASQLKSGSPTYGLMYEMYVIAAVVVGGTSLSGGQGKVLGTLIGAFIIAVIQNGLNLTGVPDRTQLIIFGAVILGAVLFDRLKKMGSGALARWLTARTNAKPELEVFPMKRLYLPLGAILIVPFWALGDDTAEREELLKRAEASVKAAAEKVKNDPHRPIYHLQPPAYWNNDPNGPVFYKGHYHLFYQLNPYGDAWGHMHWGHFRSQDLVRWEQQPIALWPSKSHGEEHVFSGCAALTKKGQLMLIYTSIGSRLPEQWAAISEDDSLVKWKKHPANPLLTEKLHGDTKVHEWRDPFVFEHGGSTYLVCGGNLNANKGGQAVVAVYRAENDDLTKWKYLGVLFQHPDKDVKNIECPLFFPIGDKWVLVVSQGRPVQYFVGDLDDKGMKFMPKQRGVMDYGNYYAPNCMADAKGRRILWGWVPDFPGGKGWNGCMTLPRVLSIADDGTLRQRPAPELEKLRGKGYAETNLGIAAERVLEGVKGAAVEIIADFDIGSAKEVGLNLRRSADGTKAVPVTFDGKKLHVAGQDVPLPLAADEKTLRLHIFLDHSVLEVYANGRACITRVIQADPKQQGVSIFARGGKARLTSLEAWPVNSIWTTAGR